MAATCARSSGGEPRITIVTPEGAPLELFGRRASAAIQELLEKRGIGLRCSCYPVDADGGGVRLVPGGYLVADRVVATPRLEGPFVEGVPHDEDGFIPTDPFGRVRDLEDAGVYAAGDVTSFPVKQGGLAAQQADAVGELIAAEAGSPVEPHPFRPVLRGLLLTGAEPSYLRAEITGGRGETSVAASEALWWPPSKVVGKYLASHLAQLASPELLGPPDPSSGVPIEIQLSR
jgi:sulfide:quinone oxidoreductase